MAVNFLTESSKDFVETKTVGGFCSGIGQNDFDGIFTEAYNGLMSKNIDIMRDINELIRNKAVLGAFKDNMLGELRTECAEIRGFKYLGPVTVYSHLQACGIINDHGCDCPRYAVVNAATETIRKRRNREQGVVNFGQ